MLTFKDIQIEMLVLLKILINSISNKNHHLQVKIPSNLQDNGNAGMAEFLKTLCTTCRACQNLITLDPGPEQCSDCETTNPKRSMKMADSVLSPPSPKRDRPNPPAEENDEATKPASSNGTSERIHI